MSSSGLTRTADIFPRGGLTSDLKWRGGGGGEETVLFVSLYFFGKNSSPPPEPVAFIRIMYQDCVKYNQ